VIDLFVDNSSTNDEWCSEFVSEHMIGVVVDKFSTIMVEGRTVTFGSTWEETVLIFFLGIFELIE
jgi:hypothetical protein